MVVLKAYKSAFVISAYGSSDVTPLLFKKHHGKQHNNDMSVPLFTEWLDVLPPNIEAARLDAMMIASLWDLKRLSNFKAVGKV